MSYAKTVRMVNSDKFKQREEEIMQKLLDEDWSERAAGNEAFRQATREVRNGKLEI